MSSRPTPVPPDQISRPVGAPAAHRAGSRSSSGGRRPSSPTRNAKGPQRNSLATPTAPYSSPTLPPTRRRTMSPPQCVPSFPTCRQHSHMWLWSGAVPDGRTPLLRSGVGQTPASYFLSGVSTSLAAGSCSTSSGAES